jgi:NAD(P)-dependent dehydrogenase (short-subunit alcohol dehydrogenase family)
MKTVLITGCSSGFGLETARHFLAQGWHVVATMRTPRAARADLLPPSERLRVLALDVTDAASIRDAVAAAGPIDVLVNNAGFGAMSIFEALPMESARALFETNTLGTMAVTQAVLPQMRERRAGVIVNVTSIVTSKALPLLSVYAASKAAVEMFSASLALELAPFDVQVKLVQPGSSPTTQFGANARERAAGGFPAPYADFVQGVFDARKQSTAALTEAQDVAQAVWRAATDPAAPLRIPAGADAVAMAAAAV